MQSSLCMLLGYAALTLLLVFIYVGYRVGLVLSMKVAANAWPRGAAGHPDPAFITRAQHAHLNCVENLPVVVTVVAVAFALGKLELLNPLAGVFLGLRMGQSLVHLISTSAAMVFIRANLFLAQLAILVYWIFLLVR
ncbi:MAG: MAPEG family protein [Burkholderiales bacterium]|nr:MAPEG family protein [Burkholderiales bacterium]